MTHDTADRDVGSDSDHWLWNLIAQTIENVVEERGDEELSDDLLRKAVDRVPDAIDSYTPKLVDGIVEKLKASSLAQIRDHRMQAAEFEARLMRRWGDGLDQLRLLYVASLEAGERFLNRVVESDDRSDDAPEGVLIDTLVRLHALACRVFAEILHLLEGGFAAGAMARWRTLHEIRVTAAFIAKHGSAAAERYRMHEGIVSGKAAVSYHQHCEVLGLKPLEDHEFEALQQNREDLCAGFGKAFKEDYGWAASLLDRAGGVTFLDIERNVGESHLRPFYGLACHSVHAGPKAISFDLGLLEPSSIMLAGPSNAGLLDPAQCAALSLVEATATLLNARPTYTSQVSILVLLRLRDEAIDAMGRAHDQLQTEHEGQCHDSVTPQPDTHRSE